ncbi:MAG: rRNA (Uracil1939-C5)-methyltransferase [Myxococcaceae bacterium]|nr:rRNA (Uracil1939-C5)-methyltransferase [Myxococcaceae bacterium]
MESLTLEGEGVGTSAKREVWVPGVFPSERAKVRIEAVSKHHPRAHGRLVELQKRHMYRRRAPCVNHAARDGHCTGCPLMEIDEKAQRRAKRMMLLDRFGLDVSKVEPGASALGYRFSSKRVAFGRRGFVYLGSFAHGTHLPATMRGCLVDHPSLVRAFEAVESAVCQVGMAPYDEKTGAGDLRYAWAKTNGSDVIVTLTTASSDTKVRELIPLLKSQLAGVLHSVQPGTGNSMRGSSAELLFGQSEVTVELLSQRVEVGALGFVQPNPEVAELAYRSLTQRSERAPNEPTESSPRELDTPPADASATPAVPQGQLAFDLYAGAGITTRMLAREFAQVVACESNAESARALAIEPEDVEQFLSRELESPTRRAPELVIANPPRKGLGARVTAALVQLAAPRLHIMSCGPEGLARDLAALGSAYELVSLEAFDTLPQTPHVELVAKLVRRAT